MGIAMLVGYVLPTHLMNQDPEVVGWVWKQRFIAIWQGFPIWVSLSQQSCAWILAQTALGQTQRGSFRVMRLTYAALLVLSFFSGLLVIKEIALAYLAPERLTEGMRTHWTYRNVFVPQDWRGNAVHDLNQGTKLLLLYDEIVTGIAFRIWGLAIYLDLPDRFNAVSSWRRMMMLGLGGLFLWLPVGFAVAIVWIREEVVYEEEAKEKKNA